ncbi:MAG: Hsp20/alpha crystallin family protein [Planctomycetota bacterium]
MFGLMSRPADLGFEVLSNRFRTILDGLEGAPAIDLYEGAEGWTAYVELPGVRPEDVNMHVENGVLAIEVKKAAPAGAKDLAPVLRERVYGTFRREVALPEGVDAERIDAGFQDGVLVLTLAKREDAKPKRIEIRVKA